MIEKYLIIALAKLQIDILNLDITFRRCKNIPITSISAS